MTTNNKLKKTGKNKKNSLFYVSVAVVVLAAAVVFVLPNLKKNYAAKDNNTGTEASADGESIQAALNQDGDVVIPVADITEKASFYDYESNGIKMQIFAVKASDGTIRTALNTCQVCNGSPYAFFKQEKDIFQCQNCGNQFKQDMIEQERGGCNPVPITADNKTVNDKEITIPASFLDENAVRFENWKKF